MTDNKAPRLDVDGNDVGWHAFYPPRCSDGISTGDEFCGQGGSSYGAGFVPFISHTWAANHLPDACRAYQLNFPGTRMFQEDVTKLNVDQMPHVDCYLASPICPPFTSANGMPRDFDLATKQQRVLFDVDALRQLTPKQRKRIEEYKRGRLLMHEVTRYLEVQVRKGTPVLIGVMENVPQARQWADWDAYRKKFHRMGYRTRLIALNSMFAQPVRAPWVPQSRNRLFLAYWLKALGRNPDWDKWLRPRAYCPQCDQVVYAVQVWKKPGVDMGSWGPNGQYVYLCPSRKHRQELFPPTRPAITALDLSKPGVRIGDRAMLGMDDLEPPTMQRIRVGYARHWLPLLVPTGGAWRAKGDNCARPVNETCPTLTTRECDGLAVPPLLTRNFGAHGGEGGYLTTSSTQPARTVTTKGHQSLLVPPLLVPVEGRDGGKDPKPATDPIRTQTTRAETAVAVPLPFITPLRGGGDKDNANTTMRPAGTVTAGGNHHGLVMPAASMLMRNQTPRGGESRCTPTDQPARTVTSSSQQSLLSLWAEQILPQLVPYYGSERSLPFPINRPSGTLSTRDTYGMASLPDGRGLFTREQAELWTPGEEFVPEDVTDEMLANVFFRMLDPEEVTLLMGFDDAWQLLPGASKRTLVKLAGNAVTPAAMEVIVSALVECLVNEDLPRELTLAA
ncbi:MAG TPA: DNA cytosine methyltransferase [Rugosimonospora sp.]|nr:DNA cytosine methyltransferase [Rugosimonospora sp.]